ncbi:uncharacterized protein [Typha latifolia]|uniref:uncharacterized protein n=1 Tax=Typha latifolia TaxID=4733 RepID=UPI003C3027E3
MAAEDEDISSFLSDPSVSDEKVVELSDAFSTVLSLTTGSSEKESELSPEEVAWVDSCLRLDYELTDESWTALNEALLEALGTQSSTYETLNANGTLEEGMRDDESVQPSREPEQTSALAEEHQIPIDVPRDGVATVEISSGFQQDTESRESIFKEWDLETPFSDDDDELIKQLKKLLAGKKDDTSMSPSEEKIDELAINMSDLSLQKLDD